MKERLERVKVYNLSNGYGLGRRIAHRLGKEPSLFRGLVFDKGKRLFYPLERVEGESLYIIQDLWGNRGERIVNLLLFIDECQKERPKEINVIIPYIPFKSYRAQDRENLIVFLESLKKAGVSTLFTLDNNDPVLIENRILKVKTIAFSQVFLSNIEYFAYKCGFLNDEITLISPNWHYMNRLNDFASNLPGCRIADISLFENISKCGRQVHVFIYCASGDNPDRTGTAHQHAVRNIRGTHSDDEQPLRIVFSRPI